MHKPYQRLASNLVDSPHMGYPLQASKAAVLLPAF